MSEPWSLARISRGLLAAWREVRRAHPVDLVMAGRRRADRPPFAAEPGLHILGEVPDARLAAFYSGALAFVYPSFYEGFGLPVLEAMQCGACVIASRAMTEVAGERRSTPIQPRTGAGHVGYRATSRSAPEWRERSLARAREFSWDRTARATYAVYREARKRFGR